MKTPGKRTWRYEAKHEGLVPMHLHLQVVWYSFQVGKKHFSNFRGRKQIVLTFVLMKISWPWWFLHLKFEFFVLCFSFSAFYTTEIFSPQQQQIVLQKKSLWNWPSFWGSLSKNQSIRGSLWWLQKTTASNKKTNATVGSWCVKLEKWVDLLMASLWLRKNMVKVWCTNWWLANGAGFFLVVKCLYPKINWCNCIWSILLTRLRSSFLRWMGSGRFIHPMRQIIGHKKVGARTY